ncbi:type IV toxin-antitoxin system AbiEi family antitoxin domain-containing protein [Pseudomonas gregormendelii]|nr:type IV toxin-antitoxin system AbiEi family antitoxin domain-containing protein [Pseudomonas gregormendelii]
MTAHRDTAFRELQMLEAAKKGILDSGDFLPLDQMAQRLGLSPMNLSKWEAEGKIFSIQHGGCPLFPKYVFLADSGHRPVAGLEVILDVLRTEKGGWGIAFWFASPSSYLGGSRPQNVLHSDADNVLLAAQDEVVGITHG